MTLSTNKLLSVFNVVLVTFFVYIIFTGDADSLCDENCTANFDSSRRLCWGPGSDLCQKSTYLYAHRLQ